MRLEARTFRRFVSSPARPTAPEQQFRNIRLIAGSSCEPVGFIDLPANAWLHESASGTFNDRQVSVVPGAYLEVPVASSTKPVVLLGACFPHDRDALLWIRACDPVTLQHGHPSGG